MIEAQSNSKLSAAMMLVLCPCVPLLMFVLVMLGIAPGIAAGHPPEYLEGTCIAVAIVTVILPILRLMNVIVLPHWFLMIIYFDLYMYVTTLCCGLYFTISWWGDLSHVISSIVVSDIILMALCVMTTYSPSHVTLGSEKGFAVTLFIVSMSFGGMWELIECSTDLLAGSSYMVYGAAGSLADMAADAIGAAIVAVYAMVMLKTHSPADMISGLKLRPGSGGVGHE